MAELTERRGPDAFASWLDALERRHRADLTMTEVARALRALSSGYVEHRERLRDRGAFDGAGKRAAYALFYGPLHFMLVREIAARLAVPPGRFVAVADLGCGTGAVGAALALAAGVRDVIGIDRHPWALDEASRTYRHFDLRARTRRLDIASPRWPSGPIALAAGYVLNELEGPARDAVLARLLDRASSGSLVLVVEPLARAAAPWWAQWASAVVSAGGRADEWRLRIDLPRVVAALDRAAGLDHRELTGRTLYVPGARPRVNRSDAFSPSRAASRPASS
jgi:hypothetical protein